MSYCVICGAEITDLEDNVHYNRCCSCYDRMNFCLRCEKKITTIEFKENDGRCFTCFANEIQRPRPTKKIRNYLLITGTLLIFSLANYVAISFIAFYASILAY